MTYPTAGVDNHAQPDDELLLSEVLLELLWAVLPFLVDELVEVVVVLVCCGNLLPQLRQNFAVCGL